MIPTLHQQWAMYLLAAYGGPNAIGLLQRREIKRAFFAGAWAMMATTFRAGDDSMTDEQSLAILDRAKTEIDQFVDLVKCERD